MSKCTAAKFFDNSDDISKLDYSKVRVASTLSSGRNIWLMKVDGLNRGFGVEIFSSLPALKKLVELTHSGYQENIVQENKKIIRSKTIIKASKFVIQKYIERPILFRGFKMDFRVWVMISHDMKLYVFRESYVRLSSEKFSFNNINEKFVHLTNNALQKYSNNYEENATLKDTDEFEKATKEDYKNDYNFRTETWPQILTIVKITFDAVAKSINENNKKLAFEIFGYDFMIDESFKVWLIEVNTNPSITTPGSLLPKYVPRMIDDAFRLTLDKIFPNPLKNQKLDNGIQKSYPLRNYDNEKNLWDLLT